MCGEDSSVMEHEGSKSKSRRVRLMVSRYGQDDDDGVDDVMIVDDVLSLNMENLSDFEITD